MSTRMKHLLMVSLFAYCEYQRKFGPSAVDDTFIMKRFTKKV